MASFDHSSLQVRVDRVDRVLEPGGVVAGTVVARVRKGWRHQESELRALGAVEIAHHLRPFMNGVGADTAGAFLGRRARVKVRDRAEAPPPAAELLESITAVQTLLTR